MRHELRQTKVISALTESSNAKPLQQDFFSAPSWRTTGLHNKKYGLFLSALFLSSLAYNAYAYVTPENCVSTDNNSSVSVPCTTINPLHINQQYVWHTIDNDKVPLQPTPIYSVTADTPLDPLEKKCRYIKLANMFIIDEKITQRQTYGILDSRLNIIPNLGRLIGSAVY